MNTKRSFEPIIDDNSKVIILGTIPGEQSLKKGEYYANPNNQFWRLIFSQWNMQVPLSYKEKCMFLHEKGIAVYDVLKSAERVGSLDSNIRDSAPNDFKSLFQDYPKIEYLFFNGGKAEVLFRRNFPNYIKKMKYLRLPSSSPTPGKNVLSYSGKKEAWKAIQKVL